jgi:DNA-directed RNA polymerase specialized sigma24 family protein
MNTHPENGNSSPDDSRRTDEGRDEPILEGVRGYPRRATLYGTMRSDLRECLRQTESALEGFINSAPCRTCVALRITQASSLLQLQGYSEHVAYAASDAAGKVAIKAIENGKAWELKNRGGWFWKVSSRYAHWLSLREPLCFPLDEALPFDEYDDERIAELSEAIWTGISRLPSREREAIICSMNGSSLRAMSEQFDMAVSAVNRLLRNARESLRPILLPVWKARFAS